MEELKTITLCDADENPLWTLCPGHVTLESFKAAFEAEGWDDPDITQDELTHEHWKKIINGQDVWIKSNPQDSEAQPVTVMGW